MRIQSVKAGFSFSLQTILWGLSLFPFGLASVHAFILISHAIIGAVLSLIWGPIGRDWSYSVSSWLANAIGASDVLAEALDSIIAPLPGVLIVICTVRIAASVKTELAQLIAILLILSMAFQSLLVRAMLQSSPLIDLSRTALCVVYALLCLFVWWRGRIKATEAEINGELRQSTFARYATIGLIFGIVVMGFYGWRLLAELRST